MRRAFVDYELVIVVAHGEAIPEQLSGTRFAFAQKGGFEAEAVKVIVGCRYTGHVAHGGKEVDADGKLVGDAVGGYCSGPPCNGRDAVAAFPYRALVPAQRGVGFGILTGAAVVGEEDDEGVFFNSEFPHCAHDFGQAVVHGFHHLAIGFSRVVGMKVGFFWTANGGIVWPLQWGVYGFVCNVEAKGRVFVVFDELHRMLRDEVRGIAFFFDVFEALPPVVHFHAVVVRDVVDVAADISAKAIKVVVHGIEFFVVPEVPFAKDGRGVAGLFEQFGKGDFRGVQSHIVVGTFGIGADHFGHARTLLIASGEESGARGAANRTAGVKVGEFKAFASHLFHCGRVDPASVRTGIAIAHVVGEYDDDVGFVHILIHFIHSKAGYNGAVFAFQNVVGIDAVGVVFCAAYGLHLGAVIAEAHGFSPLVGAVAIGPVDDLIAKEDDIPGVCRDQDGVDFVGVVIVWRQMRRGVWTQDVDERTLFVAAGHHAQAPAFYWGVVQVKQAIDKIGTVVRIKGIVLVHGKRRAEFWRFGMEHGVVPLYGVADQVFHTADESFVEDGASPGCGVELGIVHKNGFGVEAFVFGQVSISPRPSPTDGFIAPVFDDANHFRAEFGGFFRGKERFAFEIPVFAVEVDLFLCEHGGLQIL